MAQGDLWMYVGGVIVLIACYDFLYDKEQANLQQHQIFYFSNYN